ncbi:helix-turn-helix transcriptional regulator [Parathalassolituus penaei]|uniref:YafY family protein n=1 Tax=Parathalassolituus penaei TaxID=2997323 RepID=A0A9X3EFR6_9GAMM|nr:YafY family protein [Parathalassolituus penaei]MCY0966798.1 YafY family protein [Parathalassolituus penaei]
MSRAGRLLQLLELLRGYRYPVQGQVLADELGISLRTFYRDIATLQQQGACIEGEAGVGYVLKPGFTLPPLVFSAEELEALVLGMRWVASQGDSGLQNAARQAESRIRAVLPAGLLDHMESNGLLVVPNVSLPEHQVDIQKLREAMRAEQRVDLTYADANGVPSQRRIWPFALGYFERVRVLVAWCELRGDFRHFRTDRIQSWRGLDEQYPLRRRELLRRWRLTLPGSARQS